MFGLHSAYDSKQIESLQTLLVIALDLDWKALNDEVIKGHSRTGGLAGQARRS